MVKARRGIGHGTSSLLKYIEQLRLLRSNTPKREVGVTFGCLITAAAKLLWQMMPWMSMPLTLNQVGSSK